MNKVIAGMDLHSNNVVIGVMDMEGKRVASRKVECQLSEVVKFLAPFKKRLEQVAVESTYNWYCKDEMTGSSTALRNEPSDSSALA